VQSLMALGEHDAMAMKDGLLELMLGG